MAKMMRKVLIILSSALLCSCAKAAPVKNIDFLTGQKWCVSSNSDVKCYLFNEDYTFTFSRQTQKFYKEKEGSFTINKQQLILTYSDGLKEVYHYDYKEDPKKLSLSFVRKENVTVASK